MRPDELQTLTELDRSTEAVKLYTDADLRVAVADGHQADVIEYNEKLWQVMSVEKHKEGLLDHNKIIAERVN